MYMYTILVYTVRLHRTEHTESIQLTSFRLYVRAYYSTAYSACEEHYISLLRT